ncbi:hypothetical protein FWF48_01960 [Candidatus Saccharibacteria bacterium]|nr:hypothetical protein [Candidatus Saccharibacteria bacterium]
MAKFINIARSKSILSQAVYVLLNLLLAAAVFGLVALTNSPVLACILVLLSKWRMLAVRPRFWWANLQSNTLDIIVGISFALLIYLAGSNAWLTQSVLAALYAVWLLIVKPSDKPFAIEIQAGVALFLGLSASVSLVYGLHSSVLLALSFAIGYVTASHVLVGDDVADAHFISLIVGLVLAEFSWISYHWLIAYSVPGTTLRIPQLAIVAVLLGFAAVSIYRAYKEKHNKLKLQDCILPVGFSVTAILIILIFFSGTLINIGG